MGLDRALAEGGEQSAVGGHIDEDLHLRVGLLQRPGHVHHWVRAAAVGLPAVEEVRQRERGVAAGDGLGPPRVGEIEDGRRAVAA